MSAVQFLKDDFDIKTKSSFSLFIIINTIDREKEIKNRSHNKKIALVEIENIFREDTATDQGLWIPYFLTN